MTEYKIKSQLDRTRSNNMRYAVRGKWEILEDYKDGTSRCRCTNCKNTYRLSKQTIYGFTFCPRCSSYNRDYDGYESNKWIEGFRNPADVLDKDRLNRLFESDNNQ